MRRIVANVLWVHLALCHHALWALSQPEASVDARAVRNLDAAAEERLGGQDEESCEDLQRPSSGHESLPERSSLRDSGARSRPERGREGAARRQRRLAGPSTDSFESLYNKVLDVRTFESAHLLLVTVGTEITDILATQPTGDSMGCNFEPVVPACGDGKHVAFRLDAASSTEAAAEELIRQAALAAKLAPFRAKFMIDQDDCIEVAGEASRYHVGLGLRIFSLRP